MMAKRYIARFLGLIVCFTLLMTLVYTIPQDQVSYRQDISAYILSEEGEWRWLGNLFGTQAGRLDNTTDSLMMSEVLVEDGSLNAFEAAMSVNGYARYWHGYMVLLRPMLLLYDYYQIRYINMFAFFLLLGVTLRQMDRRMGAVAAGAFLFSLIACYLTVIPMSMQYSPAFYVMLFAVLAMVSHSSPMRDAELPLLFMTVGMVVCFLDLLTVPLLTLGMPLLCWIHLDLRARPERDVRVRMKLMLSCCVAWTLGYGLCWACKWVMASLALGENVVADAIDSILFRTGSDGGDISRVQTLGTNLSHFFNAYGLRVSLLTGLPVLLLALCALCFPAKGRARALQYLPVMTMPLVWYAVLNNHSSVHFWFTNRLLAILLFGLLLMLDEAADVRRARAWFENRLSGRKN